MTEALGTRIRKQIEATHHYLVQNGIDAHFASILMSHYSDFAGEADRLLSRLREVEGALTVLTDNIEQAWPSMMHLGPLVKARAALSNSPLGEGVGSAQSQPGSDGERAAAGWLSTPVDWVLVPREPTEEVARAGCYHRCATYACIKAKTCQAEAGAAIGKVGGIYRAMISASPTPPIAKTVKA